MGPRQDADLAGDRANLVHGCGRRGGSPLSRMLRRTVAFSMRANTSATSCGSAPRPTNSSMRLLAQLAGWRPRGRPCPGCRSSLRACRPGTRSTCLAQLVGDGRLRMNRASAGRPPGAAPAAGGCSPGSPGGRTRSPRGPSPRGAPGCRPRPSARRRRCPATIRSSVAVGHLGHRRVDDELALDQPDLHARRPARRTGCRRCAGRPTRR